MTFTDVVYLVLVLFFGTPLLTAIFVILLELIKSFFRNYRK